MYRWWSTLVLPAVFGLVGCPIFLYGVAWNIGYQDALLYTTVLNLWNALMVASLVWGPPATTLESIGLLVTATLQFYLWLIGYATADLYLESASTWFQTYTTVLLVEVGAAGACTFYTFYC
jgi:hypothetical protein